MRRCTLLMMLTAMLTLFVACTREPVLHLHRDGHIHGVEIPFPEILLDLDVMWDYDLGYNWQDEWTYGWDDDDIRFFKTQLGYTEPTSFELTRYYLDWNQNAQHTEHEKFYVPGTQFRASYKFGYYDVLVWNYIDPEGGVQSLWFDEQTTLDSIMAFTNMTMMSSGYHAPAYNRSFYQPEELFAVYERNLFISPNIEDYDAYDPERNVYIKHMHTTLMPLTYIYLTQVRLHNNRGRIEGVDGNANLSGMARGVTLNSGIANRDPVSVFYNVRFKRDCVIKQTNEHVDVAGGRCLTFGITNQNSSRASRSSSMQDAIRHYIDVHFTFNNGMDSTMVFDVTDQVRERFRGGVLTIDLDVDTIPIPSRSGGSGFDAVVEDFEEERHEFEM